MGCAAHKPIQPSYAAVHQILVLGAGESGKSTVLKQLKGIAEQDGIKGPEAMRTRRILRMNIIECIQALVDAVPTFSEGKEVPEADMEYISDMDFTPSMLLTEGTTRCIERLWASPGIQATFRSRAHFWLLDSCKELLDNVRYYEGAEFQVTERLALLARARTSGVVKQEVTLGKHQAVFFDAGGQAMERQKWGSQYTNATGVVFLAGMVEYNQVMFEDVNRTRMDDSLSLWSSLLRDQTLSNLPFLLLLNKKDLFPETVQEHPITVCFPEAADTAGDVDKSQDFIMTTFERAWKNRHPYTPLMARCVSALDRASIKPILAEFLDFATSHVPIEE